MKNNFKKINKEFEIIELDDNKTFTISKKDEKIIVHDAKIIENVIEKKFNEKYKRLLYIIMNITTSEDSEESDAEIVRNNIEELRILLLNKYSNFIKKELLNKYLKMLVLLEEKIVIPEKSRGR